MPPQMRLWLREREKRRGKAKGGAGAEVEPGARAEIGEGARAEVEAAAEVEVDSEGGAT